MRPRFVSLDRVSRMSSKLLQAERCGWGYIRCRRDRAGEGSIWCLLLLLVIGRESTPEGLVNEYKHQRADDPVV